MQNPATKDPFTVKITVICHNTPYPPTHGGKLDMWNSLKMLSDLGARLQIISWDDKDQSAETNDAINSISESHHLIKLSRKLSFRIKHIHLLLLYPWFASIRWPSKKHLNRILDSVREFKPDALLLHGWHGALIAFNLEKVMGIPIFYRSHNIEHLYIKNQGNYAIGFKEKIINRISQWHMKKFERRIIQNAKISYAISNNDHFFFKNEGYGKVDIILPFVNLYEDLTSINSKPIFDLSFLGNLHTLNNLNGLQWLLAEVMPIVWKKNNDVTLIISGSSPRKELIAHAESYKQVTLVANPGCATKSLSSGKIYINPVISAGGIQLKNIQMAAHGRPMIARPQSLMGLPEPVKRLFTIAESPDAFANAILTELEARHTHKNNNLEVLAKYFGSESAMKIINDIKSLRE